MKLKFSALESVTPEAGKITEVAVAVAFVTLNAPVPEYEKFEPVVMENTKPEPLRFMATTPKEIPRGRLPPSLQLDGTVRL